MKKHILLLFLGLCSIAAKGQTYETRIFNPDIKTLQIYPEGRQDGFPILEINGDGRLIVSFDEMVFSERTFYYKIIHCNRNWQKSPLSEIEYYDGFTENRITDVNLSENTVKNYTNYRFEISNKPFKASGNYAVLISGNSDFTRPDAVARFYVLDRNISIDTKATSKTSIGLNTQYQQLEIEINNYGYNIQNPFSELNLYVMQNRRTDNMAKDIKPTFTTIDKQTYSNNNNLIFEGGNEYRFIDFSDEYSYSGEVEKIDIKHDRYNLFTMPAYPRNRQFVPENYGNGYGHYIINRKNYRQNDYNADYMQVNFVLPDNLDFYNYDIYILGDVFGNRLDETSKMELLRESGIRHKSVLLKQGGYSFLYAFVPKNSSQTKATLIPFEGSFWQTSNEYIVLAYHTPFGAKYDHLVGAQIFFSKM